MFTLITFLFFIIILVFFSLFLDKKEFWWKITYLFASWSILFIVSYFYSEYFLKTFESYLWNFIFIKNFQDLLTIKIELALFLANNGLLYIFALYLYFLIKGYFAPNEMFLVKVMFASFFYLNIYSFLLVRFDIFLSNWELLQKDLLLNKVDIQIDYLLFFHEFFDDWNDLYKTILIMYAIIFGVFFMRITVNRLRILLYTIMFVFQIYFFGLLSVAHLLLLCFFSFLILESFIFFYLMVRTLHKIKIKEVLL